MCLLFCTISGFWNYKIRAPTVSNYYQLVTNDLFKVNDGKSVVIMMLNLNMAVRESVEMPKTTSELLGTSLNSLLSKLKKSTLISLRFSFNFTNEIYLRQITTGYRKWAQRYIADCGLQPAKQVYLTFTLSQFEILKSCYLTNWKLVTFLPTTRRLRGPSYDDTINIHES